MILDGSKGAPTLRDFTAVTALFFAALAAGCSDAASGPRPPPETLTEWALFEDAPSQTPAEGVIPFEVISPLFSDYSLKRRFLYVPEGRQITYDDEGPWVFPVGTVLVKTFAYPGEADDEASPLRLLETRLLVREEEGFVAHTYLWNDEQTEAYRIVAGARIDVTFTDPSGVERSTGYRVPNLNECQQCHGRGLDMDTLGGVTRQLDRELDYGAGPENQIDHLESLGLFDAPIPGPALRRPLVDPEGEGALVERVRAYLDSNCGHCHRHGGEAGSSGLFLAYSYTDPDVGNPTHWGVCKVPLSASGANCGLLHDVVPGEPDQSVMSCRLESEALHVMMPPLGRTLAHDEGVELVREWIEAMDGPECGG